jgi:hypothetical protein
MDNNYKERNRKSYIMMRMIYDLTMGLLILSMGLLMLFGDRLEIAFIVELDPVIRYLFGGLCLIYGGFRLYRGIKRDY